MQQSSRVDYDAIADRYDSDYYRAKSVDPELVAFFAQRRPPASLSLLDIACGTGNQLVANRTVAPGARMIGLDGSLGMLRQARRKAMDIGWVHANSSALPLASSSFDFVSNQYSFHHFRDKPGMLHEVLRVLRPGGRFAMYNMCPYNSADWLYYRYFPEVLTRDLADFWPPEQIVAEMETIGFSGISANRHHRRSERDLAVLFDEVRQRHSNSQLMVASDAAYEAGVRRIEQEIDDPSAPRTRADHLCFVTVRGDKPSNIA
jgi:ubiquinone/menaquinone biosynthesis C-methylase UbiE